MSETPARAFRISENLWTPAQKRAARESRTITDVIRVALLDYAEGRYDAVRPSRK